MNKITRVLGTTLAGTALIGGSAVAASAHGTHHDGDGLRDSHHAAPAFGPYSPDRAEHQFGSFSRHHGHGEGRFNLGPSFNRHWFHSHWGGRHHHALSFEERQDAIVAKLTRADDRLTRLIGYLSDTAASDPEGWEAAALPYLQEQQTRLEALITAVEAATDEDELKAAFQAAFPKPTPAPTPSVPPTPSVSPTA